LSHFNIRLVLRQVIALKQSGEMAEWSKAPVLKTGKESLSHRHI